MKILFSFVFLFSIARLQAQDLNFQQTVDFIQKKVNCCSVPFSKSTTRKVNHIAIAKNGEITISYSDNKPKQTFNLFELYKESEDATGIDTIMGGKFIQFYANEKRIRLIRFASAADAKEVYAALLRLFILCTRETKLFGKLNFVQTLEVINTKLVKWSDRGNPVDISALENGNVKIKNKRNQLLEFNFFDLADGEDNAYSRNGIEIVPRDTKAHAQLAWINFNSINGSKGFIRLDCKTPSAELEIIRSAFLHLKSQCVKADSFNYRTNEAVHFISRNSLVTTANETLLKSIRSIDKKDQGDTTVYVSSNGEGWLDKDSMPTGKWNFYAKDSTGIEYLFKSGIYHHTNAAMFEVMNIDSADLAKNYHLSFGALQQAHLQTIPFIKAKEWKYYHANGALWKSVNYKTKRIPVITSIVMDDPEHEASTRLTIQLKEEQDEWIENGLIEFDEKGKPNKKLVYDASGEVYKKIMYGKNGKIIKTEIARPYNGPLLPTNY